MPLASMAIGAGTSIAGGILGSRAASDAARAQAEAANKAANYAQQTGGASLAAQTGATQQATRQAQPYMQAGAGAVNQLSSLLGPGGALAQGWNQQFAAPTAEQAAATPGYQFALGQGQQALQRSAAARGGLLSSGTMKSLDQYSQGLASQTYQQTYNNAFQNYLNQQGTFYQNQQNQYNRLMGLTGVGQQTTNQLNQLLQAGAQNTGDINKWMSGMYGQDITNMGAAQASGIMGQANALSGMLSGIGSAATGGMALRGLSNSWTQMPSASQWGMGGGGNFGAGWGNMNVGGGMYGGGGGGPTDTGW